MKKITNWLGAHWRPLLLGTASFAILFLVGLYNLESITNGNLSNQEVVALKNAASGKDILADPLNLPFKLGQYALISLGNTSVFFCTIGYSRFWIYHDCFILCAGSSLVLSTHSLD